MLGAGGHANSILNVASALGLEVAYVIDEEKFKNSSDKTWQGIQLLGSDKLITKFSPSEYGLILGIGPSVQTSVRTQLFGEMTSLGYDFPVLISPNAVISMDAVIERGTQILFNSYIGPGARIGSNCVINTGTIVEHDVRILDNVHLAPGSCVLGGCTIGQNCFIGAKSCVIQNMIVPDDTFVKAGKVYSIKCI